MDSPNEEEELGFEAIEFSRNPGSSYQKLDLSQVEDLMRTKLEEVKEVIDLPLNQVRILLNHVRWDKTRALELYFDDRHKLLIDRHIVDGHQEDQRKDERADEGVCEICFEEVACEDMTSLSCNHDFCNDCWSAYLTKKVMSEGVCNIIRCPSNGCDVTVDDETITTIVKEPQVLERYRRLTTNSFVESDPQLRWCPTPDCNTAIKVEDHSAFQAIKCKCDSIFCFQCGEQWHEPIRCDLLKKWNRKCAGETKDRMDNETTLYILSKTKDCPNCKTTIEKDGGCNHMTCRKCMHSFCWVCRDQLATHNSISCNRYRQVAGVHEARRRLERYLHYWTRFHNHCLSLKTEETQFSATNLDIKMEKLQLRKMSWIDAHFLIQASDTLRRCRRTLMHTYPFLYFLELSSDAAILEDFQSYLELKVEELSNLIQRNIEEVADVIGFKQEVINIARHCEDIRKKLTEYVDDGYDKDFWRFTEKD